MKTALAWVKDALASKDIVQHLTHYRVADQFIAAADGRMVAAHPFPSDLNFLVPGAALEKTMAATKVESPSLTFSDSGILIKDGKFKSKIATMAISEWPFNGIELPALTPLPDNFLVALKSVRPFVSDNATQPWATAIGVVGKNLYATNNIVITRAWTGAKEDLTPILIPSWVADFILSRTDGLETWGLEGGFIAFGWANGAWLRASLVEGTFPERAGTIIDGARELDEAAGSCVVDDDYRAAVLRVAKLTDDNELSIYADRMVGGKPGEHDVEEEVDSPVPADSDRSIWNPKFLTAVIEVATMWDPAAWPNPARFIAGGVEGIITGRRPS